MAQKKTELMSLLQFFSGEYNRGQQDFLQMVVKNEIANKCTSYLVRKYDVAEQNRHCFWIQHPKMNTKRIAVHSANIMQGSIMSQFWKLGISLLYLKYIPLGQ